MKAKTDVNIAPEIGGKLHIGAMIAYIVSLVGLFLPISFNYSIINKLRHGGALPDIYSFNFVSGAIDGAGSNHSFTVILTGLAILLAVIFCFRKKTVNALISGALALILFVTLLFLIPFYINAGHTVFEMTVKLGAFFAPAAALIGIILLFLAVLLNKKRGSISN